MIAVIFEVEPAEGQEGAYLDVAADLRPRLEEVDGFVSVERFRSIANPGKIPLELIEVQTGSYLGEDDIVRFEDVYNRS